VYEINVYPEESLVVCVYSGDFLVDEIGETMEIVASHPAYHDAMNIVSDFRKAAVRYTKNELHHLSARLTRSPVTASSWCLLADSPAETAMALIFAHDLREVHPVGVFCTVKAASEFIRRDLSPHLNDHHIIRRLYHQTSAL